ncbi:phosphatidylinositol glycan anchor biosynthesis class M [Rhynchophorus ferrugineus]|uniref:GPI alpha-1,4-mannosyltransferase I, catalytic subunit n=1 Tax=Rhynchophorus ferrugineus TaxID=354439 RepID=A0A834IQ73_RHYFE|nr:hypothetical protein GWI33_008942 [Rhynchophorus ferrugineus]
MKKNMHQTLLYKFINRNTITHLICASIIRLCLVLYGILHDQSSDVQYTDIDYKVFTDAARHVVENNSPFNRKTFRYSPLIAYFLTPNIYLHPAFGKIFFCTVDILVACLIRKLVQHNVSEWCQYQSNKAGEEKAFFWGHRAMLLWLYNPMTLAISTRGNSDSLACFLVISTAYCLQTKSNPFAVGLLHGFSVHFRLYPVIYSLTYYMYLSEFSYYIKVDHQVARTIVSGKNLKNKQKHLLKKYSNQIEKTKTSIFRRENLWYIIPNINQLRFVFGSAVSLAVLTGLFYWLYGYQFLYESLIYHFMRVDFKHNFSLYFYLQYLAAWIKFDYWAITIWQPLLMNLPSLILMLFLSIYFGLNRYCLNFAILSETVVFVIYNKVVTSQYFVWIMGLLPLCIWQIKFSPRMVVVFSVIWLIAQGAWLLPAYLLEFQGENTYLYIWIQSVSLFCAHVGILGRLVKNFITTMHESKRTD